MADGHRLGEENLAVRWHPRFRLDTPVCLIVGMPDKVLLVNARLRDMSDDGGAVFAGVELVIDSEVQIEYTAAFQPGASAGPRSREEPTGIYIRTGVSSPGWRRRASSAHAEGDAAFYWHPS
jgi:hypothetical protein